MKHVSELIYKVLPAHPPPPELVDVALQVAENRGLQVDFTTTITDAGLLVWCVQIETERGTLRDWPKDLMADSWLRCLNELGLLR